MTMNAWIIYDETTGEAISNYMSTDINIPETYSANQSVIKVPPQALSSTGHDLALIKLYLNKAIDEQAEVTRAQFITSAPGQVMEYQRAREQAENYFLDDAGTYPALEADVAAGTIDLRTNTPVTTVAEAADLILYMYEAFGAIGDAIRNARLVAKAQINSATNIGQVAAITVDWQQIVADALA